MDRKMHALKATMEVPQKKKGDMSSRRAVNWSRADLSMTAGLCHAEAQSVFTGSPAVKDSSFHGLRMTGVACSAPSNAP